MEHHELEPTRSARAVEVNRPRTGGRAWGETTEGTGLAQTAQETFASPELGFTLVGLGLLAVMIWLATPTPTAALARTGAAGVGLLIAGGAALAAARATTVAVTLLVLAAAALWFEVRYVPGLGLYAVGGWFGLTLAGFTLHGTWSGGHPAVVLSIATLTATGSYLAGRRAWRRIDNDPLLSTRILTGRHTTVLHTTGTGTGGHHGQAIVGGQLWTIRSRRLLHSGQRVWVADSNQHALIVEPDPPTADHNDHHNDDHNDEEDQ